MFPPPVVQFWLQIVPGAEGVREVGAPGGKEGRQEIEEG